MLPEVLPPVEIPAEKLPPPPAPALSARFKPLLLRVIDPLTLVPENVVPVPANLVVWALGNAAEVIADVALVCWNRDELLVATRSEELLVAKALLVIADVALVCWNRDELLAAISSEELELANAAEVMADVALVCWKRDELLSAMAFVVMFVAA